MDLHCEPGQSAPLGATVVTGGVNFSFFSRSATGVELVFYDHENDAKPSRAIALDPVANRTYHYWHAFVPHVRPGQIYAYRVNGPNDPAIGLRFDPAKILLDPYGREVVVPDAYSREAARRKGDNAATAMKSVVVNYWGYQPVAFFSPHRAYSSRKEPLGPVHELRDMVKALHRAGIEVILDVVFTHTSEGGEDGPTLSMHGIDNPIYYVLDQGGASYADYSGCGNTLNANNPVVRRMIVNSLRYWVTEMHVDGFRFDLASILSRDSRGQMLPNPPVLWDIETDPALAGTKLIAEAWDVFERGLVS